MDGGLPKLICGLCVYIIHASDSPSTTAIPIINMNTTATDVYFRQSRSIRAPPCCAVGHFISRRVRVTGEASSGRRVRFAGSHGPAESAIDRYRQRKLVG